MSVEAEVANQVVSQSLKFGEHAARLTALGAKNLAALLVALCKSYSKTHGKNALCDLIMSSGEPQQFEMTKQQATKFKRLAKEHGVTAIPIRDKTSNDGIYNVIVRGEDAKCVELVFQKMNYAMPTQEVQVDEKKPKTRSEQGNESQRRGNTSTQSQNNKQNKTNTRNTDGKPPVRSRVEGLKAASRETAKSAPTKNRSRAKSK